MLNEERIRLMTKMASYEANEGKKNVSIGSYFRGDYIGLQVIKSVISGTIGFFIIFAVYLGYDLETFMTEIYKMDLFLFGKNVVIAYLIFVGVYAIISYAVYTYRYTKAKKSLKLYYNNLKQLSSLYEKEGKK